MDWKPLSIIPLTLLLLAVLLYVAREPAEPEPLPEPPVPDFGSIQDVKLKKQAFFDFMLPMVRAANDEVWAERSRLLDIVETLQQGDVISDEDQAFINDLTVRYRLKQDPLGSSQAMQTLLRRVDTLPASLVLAQSANESGWGTARFARNGKNYFGIWCWSASCGMVPTDRNEGAKHEVASFESVRDGVTYYVQLLNSHPAYTTLREIRQERRQNEEPVTGAALAEGLINYSERREAYVEELQAMIRVNKLSQYTLDRSATMVPEA